MIYPYDAGVFPYCRREGKVPIVSNLQAYLDLYARGGRDLKQADYLLSNAIEPAGERHDSGPARTYLLELFAALGSPAKDFILAGAQAIKFAVQEARGTKDVDFILNVIALRASPFGWRRC